MMDYEQLNKAYEAVDLLEALNLPVSEEQMTAISNLEKKYLCETVIPVLKKELEPFISSFINITNMIISFSPEDGLNISLGGMKSSQSPNLSSVATMDRGSRMYYSIDGGVHLNKRRFVWEVVRKYVETHPGISFEELDRKFPASLSNSPINGVVRTYDSVINRCKRRPDLRKRFFLEKEDLITLSDGTKVTVFNQWGRSFKNFLVLAQQLHNVECFE